MNEACDAEQGSYDIMVLLTGRKDIIDVPERYNRGLAVLGGVCSM